MTLVKPKKELTPEQRAVETAKRASRGRRVKTKEETFVATQAQESAVDTRAIATKAVQATLLMLGIFHKGRPLSRSLP